MEEIHNWINSVGLVAIIFWLVKQALHQRQVIKDQSQKFTDLEKYINIFRQLNEMASPEKVIKLLDTEKMLIQQKNDIFLRGQIEEISNKMYDHWADEYEKKISPKYHSMITEFSRFILAYIKATNFKTLSDRDAFIKKLFPNNSDMVISFLDNPSDKSIAD
jgi:hypothetical protein